VSASLYWMAARMERVCSIAEARPAPTGIAGA